MLEAHDIGALRDRLAVLQPLVDSPSRGLFSLGAGTVDRALGGGLTRGAMHEIFPREAGDGGAAVGFSLALACRAGDQSSISGYVRKQGFGQGESIPATDLLTAADAGIAKKPVVWVRERKASEALGHVYAQGLAEFGLDPDAMTLVQAPDVLGALRAGHEASRCTALGAVILEIHGRAPALNHTATRRLSLAAQESGVPVLLLRMGAQPETSAARTRWLVAPAASRAAAPGLVGPPTFRAEINKHRTVPQGTVFVLEWDHAGQSFALPASPALPGAVVSTVFDRPVEPARTGGWARAG
jgi:protein ImuA